MLRFVGDNGDKKNKCYAVPFSVRLSAAENLLATNHQLREQSRSDLPSFILLIWAAKMMPERQALGSRHIVMAFQNLKRGPLKCILSKWFLYHDNTPEH